MTFVFGALLLLSGCVKSGIVSYELRYSDPSLASDLAPAALRAVQGRLLALKQPEASKSAVLNASGSVISVFLPSDVADTLTKQLATPLNFSIMTQATAADAEITVEKFGALKGSGITEKDIAKTVANAADKDGKASATLIFTPEGAAIWKKVCTANVGKILALTVRHHLVTTLSITKTDGQSSAITVSGIPPAMAQAFADDMNVGSHVAFVPLSSPLKP